jgi:hypothetical protein
VLVSWSPFPDLIPSSQRDRLYFRGVEGEKFDPDNDNSKPTKTWGFDFATKKVTPFTPALPENHKLVAVGKEGRNVLTFRIVSDKDGYSRRTFVVSSNGKTMELLKDKMNLSMAQFSPDGAKLFGIAETFTPGKPPEIRHVIFDTATGNETMLTGLPKSGRGSYWTWAPDSSRVACVWCDPEKNVRTVVEQLQGVQRVKTLYTFTVLSFSTDGSGCREVYQGEGQFCIALDWR